MLVYSFTIATYSVKTCGFVLNGLVNSVLGVPRLSDSVQHIDRLGPSVTGKGGALRFVNGWPRIRISSLLW